MQTRIRTLGWFFSLTVLGGAVSAGAAVGALPSRPVFARDAGIAPPKRIPDVVSDAAGPQGTPVTTAEIPKSVRTAVVADAAKRFNVADSAVVLVRAERVTWSDGSLGCTEPGTYYTQNLVPGYLVVAKTGAGELVYHTDSREQAKSCAWVRPKTNRKLPEAAPGRSTQPPADR
jgi:hypothetical protein